MGMFDILVVGLFLVTGICCGGGQKNGNEAVSELEARLASCKANQTSLRATLDAVRHVYQDLRSSVEQQMNTLENVLGVNGSALTGPCATGSHTEIWDDRRATSARYHDENGLCDVALKTGWYRFYLYGHNAVMPTYCVAERSCTTHVPVWLDLQGGTLPEAGQETQARGCANFYGNCCIWEFPITVRNCGDFIIYKLEKVRTCTTAYCAVPQQ